MSRVQALVLVAGMAACGFTACAQDTGVDGSSSSSGSSSGQPQTVTQDVGPAGGVVEVDGARLTIPAGALASPTTISLERTQEAAPAGYVLHSPIIRCGPDGLTFQVPATMSVAFDGNAAARMHWSTGNETVFTELTTTATGGRGTAQVRHFSRGFMGRRVDGGSSSSLSASSSSTLSSSSPTATSLASSSFSSSSAGSSSSAPASSASPASSLPASSGTSSASVAGSSSVGASSAASSGAGSNTVASGTSGSATSAPGSSASSGCTTDADNDGFLALACGGVDCDDNTNAVHPGAVETCNDGLDNDCDPATLDLRDGDGDGALCNVDCDDADFQRSPAFVEICFDSRSVDEDCSGGADDRDMDGDGHVDWACGGADCDDTPGTGATCNTGCVNMMCP